MVADEFWQLAKAWFTSNFRVAPTLALRGYRLFGMEKEPPNDLLNIFYRCARYCIFSNRRKAVIPSIKLDGVNCANSALKAVQNGEK